MTNVAGSLPRAEAIAGGAARNVRDVARLRLITGLTLILVSLISLFGGDWDIQWHGVIGRDRTFTPPHDLILMGIGLSGIVALISILIETRWVRRQHELRPYSSDFLGVLHSSLGSYLIGFGAVCSAVAPPAIPTWLAWNIGLLPIYGLLIFWITQTRRTAEKRPEHEDAEQSVSAEMMKEVL